MYLKVKERISMFIRILPAITLFALPFYLIRFVVLGAPVNLLMVWVFLVFLIFFSWLVSVNKFKDFLEYSRSSSRWVLGLVLSLLLASLVSVFVGGVTLEKLGQFVVVFLQPVLMFFVGRYIFSRVSGSREIFEKACLYFVAICGLLAWVQYFTLWTLPEIYRGNPVEPKRALAVFEYPNAYALFVAPVLAFLLPKLLVGGAGFLKKSGLVFNLACYILGVSGLFLSLSRGGWMAFLFTLFVGVLAMGKAKLRWFFVVLCLAFSAVVFFNPVFRSRVTAPFVGEDSSIYRLYMAKTSWNMIKAQPIFGMGLLGYGNNFSEYKFDSKLGHYKYPHNLLLTLWVELGLLGVLSFFGIVLYFILRAFQKEGSVKVMAVGLFLFAILVHGLVDVPYFKNDLALLFWLVLAM